MKLWPLGRKKPDIAAVCGELPIPTFVKPYLVPDMSKCSMEDVSGSIRCTCGSAVFAAKHSVDDDRLFHLICRACGQDIMLFDGQKYGWDALVCRFPMPDMQAGEAAAKCAQCGSGDFHADVWYEPAEREEYDSCREELPEDEWVNAFTWFSANLTCAHCGNRERDWADVETA